MGQLVLFLEDHLYRLRRRKDQVLNIEEHHCFLWKLVLLEKLLFIITLWHLNHFGHSGDPRDSIVSDLSFSSSPSGQLSGSGLAIKGRSGGESEVSSGHLMVGTFILILIPDLAGLFTWAILGWSTAPDFDVEN